MTLLFAYAESVLNGLIKLDQSDLPLGLVSKVKRVLRNFKEEFAIYQPGREKILREFCTVDEEKKMWMFPKPEDEKFAEFEKRWNDLQMQKLIFPYEPILYDDIIDAVPDEIKKKIVAKGSDFDVLDVLNKEYKELHKKEVSPADTSAGAETINAPVSANPDV